MRARKTDKNNDAIVGYLEDLGLRVHRTNADWDLTVQYGGISMLCEVRQAGQPRKPRKGNQERVHEHLMIHWLQTREDCVALSVTLMKWHTAICRYCNGD